MRTRSLASFALAVVLTLTSCSGDDPSSRASGSAAATAGAATTAATGSSRSPVTTAASSEQELANSLLLTVEDLTPGWAGITGTDDGQASPLESCLRKDGPPKVDPVAEARSDDFVLGDITVKQLAVIHRDAELVRAQLAEMARPSMRDCVAATTESSLREQLPDGVEVGDVAVEPIDWLTVQDGFADVLTLTLRSGVNERQLAIVRMAGGKGRALSSLSIAFTGGEIDQDLVAEIWAATEAKLQAADV